MRVEGNVSMSALSGHTSSKIQVPLDEDKKDTFVSPLQSTTEVVPFSEAFFTE
jgi:hypothetical protein